MPRVFISPESLASLSSNETDDSEHEKIVHLTGELHNYLTRVLRMTRYDKVTVFDGKDKEYPTIITAIDAKTVTLLLGPPKHLKRIDKPKVVLLQGLLKSGKMELVIQKSTELGVNIIIPTVCSRSVPKLPQNRAAKRRTRWKKIAAAAGAQCGRTDIPEIDSIKPCIEDALARILDIQAGESTDCWSVALWEECRDKNLNKILPPDLPKKRIVSLLIGPEGGLSKEEIDLCREAGFQVAGLGRLILRSETAALAALTLISAGAGLLD